MKAKFEKYELQAFDLFYHRLEEAFAVRDLVLHLNYQPYAFTIIAMEIRGRTKLGRKLLNRIKDMRLI